MAPSTKANVKDDFVFTLSDNEDDILEEIEEVAPPAEPSKKRKREVATGANETTKVSKKAKRAAVNGGDEDEGVWGAKDADDGAMNSDFEFQLEADGAGEDMDEFEGWGFEGARKGLVENSRNGDKKAVDIDEIIARRREKRGDTKEKPKVTVDAEDDSDEAGSNDNEDKDAVLDGDEEDEFLAEDGFGMGVGSDVEESDMEEGIQEDSDSENDGEENAASDVESDDESVASAVPHPDDLAANDSSDDERDEDPEEAARRDAFFAPEEKSKKSGKSEGASTFQTMSLSRPILRGLAAVGFSQPTPIQAKTIPIALLGKDVVGGAVTGSGKTAAFIVPILERLLYRPKKIPTSRVVILMPTRELAIQCHAVATKLASHTDIKFCLLVGGLSLKIQEAELRLRPDVIIATPGRFIDHTTNSASFTVDGVEILVLDEADRMLEDGFANELNEILTTLPKSRQTMLFSATMSSTVDKLIRVGLNRPVRLMVDGQKQTVGTLVQEFVRLRPGREDKRMGYLLYLCHKAYTEKVIVFFRQKKEAHRARVIFGLEGLKAAELHGSLSQEQRISSVEAFRDGKVSFLLATDLASRGLDIKGVETVINYEAPQSLEIYLHRVGRTARAGRTGRACTLAAEPDRKVVKAAVKAARTQGAKIASRIIESKDADEVQAKVDAYAEEIDEILKEEKEDKLMSQVEMQVRKGENIMVHEDEIKSRPRRTWFESEADKLVSKKSGRAELNGEESVLKKKIAAKGGKLSNKDKKKLDDREERTGGGGWKKGRAERDGKGALAAVKGKKKEKGGKPRSKMGGGGGGKSKVSGKRRISSQKQPPPYYLPKLVQYLFPVVTRRTQNRLTAFRISTNNRLTNLRLSTLPYYKHRAQRRIYDFILKRQHKAREKRARRAAGKGILNILRRRSFGIFGKPAEVRRSRGREKFYTSNPGLNDHAILKRQKNELNTGTMSAFAAAGEKGGRRKKLAGYLKAANEMRQTYQASYGSSWGANNADEYDEDDGGIPGAFPDVAIVRNGYEEMVLFPSYARRHTKKQPRSFATDSRPNSQSSSRRGSRYGLGETSEQSQLGDEEFWKREWEKYEDDKAIVDVDVRGWIYSPHRGPMTRRNRLLIGLARHLSGIPQPPKGDQRGNSSSPGRDEHGLRARHEAHEAEREQEKIAQEAEEILRKGRGEEDVANRGGYSEQPNYDSDRDSIAPRTRRNFAQSRTDSTFSKNSGSSDNPPGPGYMTKITSWNTPAEMNQAELAVANANLMARLRPFLTNPLVSTGITVFFYNDTTSQSRIVMTDDAGHFNIRAALDFVPTNVRVLASEDLSATEVVLISEPKGVSVISDVDDTIKHSSIGSGSREIFRNVFVRDLKDLTIHGVKEWYGAMHEKGVGFHYVSNSPWQLFPMLVSYFREAELPPGSYHLKQYSGMLQGIFEPVAERKKGTLEKIMRDFPERRFLLIGDSGEADLEVYTDVVLANPGRILGVFIRDVTSPPERERSRDRGFFDSSMASGERPKRKIAPPPNLGSEASSGSVSRNASPTNPATSRSSSIESRPRLPPRIHSNDHPAARPPLPARGAIKTEVVTQSSAGPAMGNLIDIDSDPDEFLPPPPRSHGPHKTVVTRSKSEVQLANTGKLHRQHMNASVPKRDPSFRAPPLVKSKPLALRANAQGEAREVWNVPTSKTAEPQLTPPLPSKPRQLSNAQDATISPSLFDGEEEQERDRQSSHPLAQTQNTSDLSASARDAYETQTWSAYGKQKVTDAYNSLPAAKDYIPVSKKGKDVNPYDSIIYSAASKSAPKANSSTKSIKSAPPPPPPRRSKAQPLSAASPSESSEDDQPHRGISKVSSFPSYSSSPKPNYSWQDNQPLSKKVILWRQRVKRAEETLRGHGVILKVWRVGDDVRDDAVALVERELRALGIQPHKGDAKPVGG